MAGRVFAFAPLACVIALTSACGGAGGSAGGGGSYTVRNVAFAQTYAKEAPTALAGVTPVEVYGAPPDGAAPQEVVAALIPVGRLPDQRFLLSTTAEPAARRGARLVYAFSAMTPERACSGEADGSAGGRTGVMTVRLAFCQGDRWQSTALLTSSQIRGPSSAGFGTALRSPASQMLSVWHPRQRDINAK